MQNNIPAISAPTDLANVRLAIVQGNQVMSVPAVGLGDALGFQPLDADLTSWATITRATGFDTFVATPSSANLRSLLTDETGTGAAVFADAPTISGAPSFTGIPSFTGGGIKFPATQVPSADANTLDDYEEGTWTPALTLATPGNLSVAYTSRSGRYVKIALMVFFNCLLQTSTWTHTTASGFLNITGFPFTMGTQFVGAGTLLMSGWTKANYTSLGFETSNSTFMYALASGSGQALAELVAADLPTGGVVRIYGSGQYTI